MPELSRLWREYQGSVGVYVVGTGEVGHLEEIRSERAPGVPMPVATELFREQVGMVAFPETLIIDAQGRVAEHLRGGEDYEYFAARVELLLSEQAASATPSPVEGTAAQGGATPEQRPHPLYARVVYWVLERFGRH